MTLPVLKGEEVLAGTAPLSAASIRESGPPQVSVYDNFEALPDSFLDLLRENGDRDFFLTKEWFQNFTQTALSPSDRVRIYTVGGTPVQVPAEGLFLARTSSQSKKWSDGRKLFSLTNYYSCFFAPHLRSNSQRAAEALRSLTQVWAAETPRWDSIEIKPLDSGSASFAILVEQLRNSGFAVQTFFSFGNWYLPVKGRSFAEYLESLPSVLKNTLSRKRKKLEKSGRVRIEIVTGGEQLESAIEAYTKIYLSSWKQPEPFPGFMPGLIRTCAKMGVLRLGLVHVDNEPAAAQLWIVHRKSALIYKLAYDERFADLSVGTILSSTLFQHALDVDKVEEVDYLSGDDAYKRDWMSHRRERWGILALNPRTPRGLLQIARHIGGRAVKRTILAAVNRFRKKSHKPEPA
jgi:hypothetical protein